jgi:CRP-like cAMP-binding protein
LPQISREHALLIKQLRTIADLDDGDAAALASLPLRAKTIAANRDIVREGSRPTECSVILHGLVCRYKMVATGRRQILSFHVTGDMPDLQSLHLGTMDHGVSALTETRLAFIPHEAIRAVIRQRRGVSDALMRYTMVDGSIFREWIANVGRRSALSRIAHVMCETYVRMRAVGLVKKDELDLPLSQAQLGDATGLSNVHVNRTLQEMKRLGLITTRKKVHSIADWDRLQETADFDPAYLHLRHNDGARTAPPA